MASIKGLSGVRAYNRALEDRLRRVLKGAGKVAGNVIAEEAKERTRSEAVAKGVVVKLKSDRSSIRVTVTIKPGWSMSVAIWEEYGTVAHTIRVGQLPSDGGRQRSLVIDDQFVGKVVEHPGAKPHPFLRPALDLKADEAIRAAQAYLNARIVRGRVITTSERDDE